MKIFSNFEKGWLSATVDGEGSISYHRRHDRYMVTIYNINLELLEKFRDMIAIPGTPPRKIYAPKRTKAGLGNHTVYEISVCNRAEILSILTQIQDFLIVKRVVAIKAIELMSKKKGYKLKGLAGPKTV